MTVRNCACGPHSATLTSGLGCAVVGAVLPLRPFFFTKPTDPATETVDLIVTPAYILGRALPPMGDFGSSVFFAAAIVANAILYGLLARYICSKISTTPTRS